MRSSGFGAIKYIVALEHIGKGIGTLMATDEII